MGDIQFQNQHAQLGAIQVKLGEAQRQAAQAMAQVKAEKEKAEAYGRAIMGGVKPLIEHLNSVAKQYDDAGLELGATARRRISIPTNRLMQMSAQAARVPQLPANVPAPVRQLQQSYAAAIQRQNAANQVLLRSALQEQSRAAADRARRPTTASGVYLEIPAANTVRVIFRTPYDGEPWRVTGVHFAGGGSVGANPILLTNVTFAGINNVANNALQDAIFTPGPGVSVRNVWPIDLFTTTALRPALKPELSVAPWNLVTGQTLHPSATATFEFQNPNAFTKDLIVCLMIQASPCGGMAKRAGFVTNQILPMKRGIQFARVVGSPRAIFGSALIDQDDPQIAGLMRENFGLGDDE